MVVMSGRGVMNPVALHRDGQSGDEDEEGARTPKEEAGRQEPFPPPVDPPAFFQKSQQPKGPSGAPNEPATDFDSGHAPT